MTTDSLRVQDIEATRGDQHVTIKYQYDSCKYEAIFPTVTKPLYFEIDTLYSVIVEAVTAYKNDNTLGGVYIVVDNHGVTLTVTMRIGVVTTSSVDMRVASTPIQTESQVIQQLRNEIKVLEQKAIESSKELIFGHYYKHNDYVSLKSPACCKAMDINLNIGGRTVNLYQQCISSITVDVIRLQLSTSITSSQLKAIRNNHVTTLVITGIYAPAKDLLGAQFSTRLPNVRRVVFEGGKPPSEDIVSLLGQIPNITWCHLNPKTQQLKTGKPQKQELTFTTANKKRKVLFNLDANSVY